MPNVKKTILATLIFLLIFVVKYLRELVFIVLNSAYRKYPFPYNAAYIKPPDFLYKLSTSTLAYSKWGLTLFFSLLFAGLTLWIVNFYFSNRQFNKITLFIYFLLLLVSIILSIIGIFVNYFESIYPISRFIAGIIQSPLLSIALFLLFYFNHKEKNYLS